MPSPPLRDAVFRAVWIASIFSYLGNWVQEVGESWLMLSLTSDPRLIAGIPTAVTVPAFLLVLPAGVLADRYDRRRILLASQLWMGAVAVALAGFTWVGFMRPALLLALAGALGVGIALGSPAWNTLVPELVSRESVPEAVTLNSMAFNIARAVGPALGGLLLSFGGPALAFALNGASFLGVLYVLQTYPRIREVAEASRTNGANADRTAQETFVGAMTNAVRHAFRSRALVAVFASVSLFAVAAASFSPLLAVHAKDGLGTTSRGYGLLLGALGVGAVAGALAMGAIRRRVQARTLIGVAMGLWGMSVLAVTVVASLPAAFVVLLPAGVGWICSLSSLNALVQLSTPAWVRSRVLALYTLFFLAFWAVGASLGGSIAAKVGVPAALRIGGFAAMAAGLVTTFLPLPLFASRDEHAARDSIAPLSAR